MAVLNVKWKPAPSALLVFSTEVEVEGKLTGEAVAEEVVFQAYDTNLHEFDDGDELAILEPAEFAGVYEVHVEHTPEFSTRKLESA